jgi:hypothetical protein
MKKTTDAGRSQAKGSSLLLLNLCGSPGGFSPAVVFSSLHKGELPMSASFELCEGRVVSARERGADSTVRVLGAASASRLWDLTMAERRR